MIAGEEIEQKYRDAVGDPLQTAVTLKNEVEANLGQSLFRAALDAPDRILDALVRAAKEKFSRVREISIADKLSRLAPKERDNKIQRADRNAHVLIQIDSERRQRYGCISAADLTQSLLVGTPPADIESALAKGGALRRAVENQVPILPENFVQTLPDRSRLLFSYEMGVFSLHCVRDFADYRGIYRTGQARHRHTHRGISFPDLFPTEEASVRARAERAAVLGRGMGLFALEREPETQDPAIYYNYKDRHGRHPVPLGRDWREVEEHLFAPQREKDILANLDRQETTPLECVEEELRQRGKQAATRRQKEALWSLLQDYLDGREAELEGGLRHPCHRVESGHINAYRDTYDLTPPAGWSPPRDGVDSSPHEGLVEALPPDSSAGDLEGFRRQVHQQMTEGGLSEEQRLALLAEAADFDLEFDEAERVLQEAESESAPSVSLNGNMPKYRERFQALWEQDKDGLTAQRRAYLQGLRKKLGLTEEQVQAVEARVTGGGSV